MMSSLLDSSANLAFMPEASTVTPPAKPYVGGQALIEGVMMRSPRSFSIVCRRRSGELVVRERPVADERKGVRAWPLVRGVVTLVESLKLGSEALRYSASLFEADLEAEEQAQQKSGTAGPSTSTFFHTLATYVSRAVSGLFVRTSLPLVSLITRADGDTTDNGSADSSTPANNGNTNGGKDKGSGGAWVTILFALVLFVALPQGAANLANKVFKLGLDIRDPLFQLITGGMKLMIVVGYLSLIRQIPEIRRVFQYHGAEHKSISTYEANEALELANARSKTTLHARCGTTFLVMVAMVSVILFSIVGIFLPKVDLVPTLGEWGAKIAENVGLFLMKLPFLPVIAAITFELQRFFARYCSTGPLSILLWPGFLVQKITTIEPDDDQLEVALASLRATLAREAAPEAQSAGVTESTFASYADFSKGWGQPAAAE